MKQQNTLSLCMLFIAAVYSIAPVSAETLEFSAGKVSSNFAEGSEQTILQNNATVENDKIRVQADTIQLSGDGNRYISGTGTVSLFDKESETELKADSFTYDSEEDILVLEGNSQFKDEKEDILIYSTFLERQPNLVVFQLNVQIIREDMLANAEYVRYFENTQQLELSGFPIVYYQDDEYSASVITVHTENNEIVLEGEVKGQLSDESEDDSTPPDDTPPDDTPPDDTPPDDTPPDESPPDDSSEDSSSTEEDVNPFDEGELQNS